MSVSSENERSPVTHRLTYGTNTVLHYVRTEGGGVRRIDRYLPDRPERYERDGILESRFAASSHDVSPPHYTYPSGYDSRCPCCYLGSSHTVDFHAAATAKK